MHHDNDDEQDRRAGEWIAGARRGDADSLNELMNLIYPELKRRARWLMTTERTGHTFGASGSELVQRVMAKILKAGGEFFAAFQTEEDLIRRLTRHMRYVLVDYARAARSFEGPDPRSRVSFEDLQRSKPDSRVHIDEVLIMHEALTNLADLDGDAARALELRFFAGLTNEEAARAMGFTVASFRRALKRGMVFLKSAIDPSSAPH